MAYEADVSISVRHPTQGTTEVLYERTEPGVWRRFKRSSSAQRWSNWPSDAKPFTQAEVLEQVITQITNGRVA
jgi:hypothetical protein